MTSAGVLALGGASAVVYAQECVTYHCEVQGLNCRETCWDITSPDGTCVFLQGVCNSDVDNNADVCNAMCPSGEEGTSCHNSCSMSAEEGHAHCNEGSCDTTFHACVYDDCTGGTLVCWIGDGCC